MRGCTVGHACGTGTAGSHSGDVGSGGEEKFLQPEIDGRPHVYFDKSGVVRFKPLDADSFASKLRERVEALRIFHDPTRHNFHTRYVHYAFPESDVKRLTELIFVASGEELAAKRERGEEWFNEVLGAITDGTLSDGIRRAAGRTKGMEDDA